MVKVKFTLDRRTDRRTDRQGDSYIPPKLRLRGVEKSSLPGVMQCLPGMIQVNVEAEHPLLNVGL